MGEEISFGLTVSDAEFGRIRDALQPHKDYPDPTPEMLNGDKLFDAIWAAIKGWDISRHNDGMYCGPTGNDVRHIYDAIKKAGAA